MDCSMPGFSVLHYFLELAQTYVHWVGNAIPCCPLFLLCSIIPSIRIFSKKSQLFTAGGQSIGALASASVLPVNIQGCFPSGLTSLTLQSKGLWSLFQHHNLKASVLQYSAFFMVQLPHLQMTTGKTKALTRQTFVSKVMSLLFHRLSRLVIAFLLRASVF